MFQINFIDQYFYQQIRATQQQIEMKESKSCYNCQRQYYNLMSANCGHKICFHCVKTTRNTSKCPQCLSNQNPRSRTPLLSPSRNVSNDPKQRSTKVKESQSKMLSEHSPAPLMRSRKSLHRSSLNWMQDEDIPSVPNIKCKEHHEPLTMFCKSSRDLICSVCVCTRAKMNNDVVPLRLAEDYLVKQTKIHREEAKHCISTVESARRIINKNTSIFQQSYKNGLHSLTTVFEQVKNEVQAMQSKLKQDFINFFDLKFKECDEISQDLSYLNSILHEYQDNSNKDSATFGQLVYMFTSFKVIKATIKSLNLDYVPYNKEVSLVEINKYHYKDAFKDCVKLKLDLPLKFGIKKTGKSQSNRSVSKSKHEDWEEVHRGGQTSNLKRQERENIFKKHQMSLCNNVHGIEMGSQQKNLYKMLLKTKFNL